MTKLKDKIVQARQLEEQIRLEVAEMKSQVDNAAAMVDIIRLHDPAYIPPWLTGKDAVKIYKVKNVADAFLAVLPETDGDSGMSIADIIAAVGAKFGTTYTENTIRQGLRKYLVYSCCYKYSRTLSTYKNDDGWYLLEVRRGLYAKCDFAE